MNRQKGPVDWQGGLQDLLNAIKAQEDAVQGAGGVANRQRPEMPQVVSDAPNPSRVRPPMPGLDSRMPYTPQLDNNNISAVYFNNSNNNPAIGGLFNQIKNQPPRQDMINNFEPGGPGFRKLPFFGVPGGIPQNAIPRAKPNQSGMTRLSPGMYRGSNGQLVRSTTGQAPIKTFKETIKK